MWIRVRPTDDDDDEIDQVTKAATITYKTFHVDYKEENGRTSTLTRKYEYRRHPCAVSMGV